MQELQRLLDKGKEREEETEKEEGGREDEGGGRTRNGHVWP